MKKTQIIQAMARKLGVELITMKMAEPEVYAGTSTGDRAGVSGLPKCLTLRPGANPINYRGYTLMKRMGVK